jgi:predicted DNA-binding antitoxin AbrB/MazE fold protein
MDLHFDAIYENGVLRPLSPLALPEHSRVRITVAPPNGNSNSADPEWFGIMPAADADEISAIIEREFEQVDPREW